MRYHKRLYPSVLAFSVTLIVIGLLWCGPKAAFQGMWKMVVIPDLLITDYMRATSPGAALFNSGVITLISIALLYLCKSPPTGMILVDVGLMAGFSLFGKNIVNILPIIAGGFCYVKFKKASPSTYSSVILMSTALSPMVTFLASDGRPISLLFGLVVGLIIGFSIPPLSDYTYRLLNGMNLYNVGFSCGLLGIIIVALVTSAQGRQLKTALHWYSGSNTTFSIMICVLCSVLIVIGFFYSGKPAWAVWAGYRRLLRTSGRAPSDYLRLFGGSAVMVNMGVNGLVGLLYILLIGGDLNGPTIGAIFCCMGFAAFGKHILNIVPIMLGVVAGGLIMPWSVSDPSLQIAGLFCTTLAPIAGFFGWPYGILAGFLHSSLVLATGTALSGMNLYNNGFSGGLAAMVLYPVISAVCKQRKPVLLEDEYMDIFSSSRPITMTDEFLPVQDVKDRDPDRT